MFTIVSKLWFIISLTVIIFVGGMVYANSSGTAPYKTPSIQSLLPGHKTIKAEVRERKTSNILPKATPERVKSAKAKPSFRSSKSRSQNVVKASAPAPYKSPNLLSKLTRSHWIKASTGLGACSMKPAEHWSFSKSQNEDGFECQKISMQEGLPVYRCGLKNSRRQKDYIVKVGSPTLGMAIPDRPYITLERLNRPSQRIGLKQCKPSDQVWSPNTTLETEDGKSG